MFGGVGYRKCKKKVKMNIKLYIIKVISQSKSELLVANIIYFGIAHKSKNKIFTVKTCVFYRISFEDSFARLYENYNVLLMEKKKINMILTCILKF